MNLTPENITGPINRGYFSRQRTSVTVYPVPAQTMRSSKVTNYSSLSAAFIAGAHTGLGELAAIHHTRDNNTYNVLLPRSRYTYTSFSYFPLYCVPIPSIALLVK